MHAIYNRILSARYRARMEAVLCETGRCEKLSTAMTMTTLTTLVTTLTSVTLETTTNDLDAEYNRNRPRTTATPQSTTKESALWTTPQNQTTTFDPGTFASQD